MKPAGTAVTVIFRKVSSGARVAAFQTDSIDSGHAMAHTLLRYLYQKCHAVGLMWDGTQVFNIFPRDPYTQPAHAPSPQYAPVPQYQQFAQYQGPPAVTAPPFGPAHYGYPAQQAALPAHYSPPPQASQHVVVDATIVEDSYAPNSGPPQLPWRR